VRLVSGPLIFSRGISSTATNARTRAFLEGNTKADPDVYFFGARDRRFELRPRSFSDEQSINTCVNLSRRPLYMNVNIENNNNNAGKFTVRQNSQINNKHFGLKLKAEEEFSRLRARHSSSLISFTKKTRALWKN
jgi:hypothetical protein